MAITRNNKRPGIHRSSQSSIPYNILNAPKYPPGCRRTLNEQNERLINSFLGFSDEQMIGLIITPRERPEGMSYEDYKDLRSASSTATKLGPKRTFIPIANPKVRTKGDDVSESISRGPRLDRHPKVKYGPRFKLIYGDPNGK